MRRKSRMLSWLVAWLVLSATAVRSAEPNRQAPIPPTSRPTDGLIVEQEETQDIPGAARAPRKPWRRVITIKGGNLRMDMVAMFSSIMLEDGRVVGLNHFGKTYVIESLAAVKEGVESSQNGLGKPIDDGDEKPKLTATGQRQKISGYDADEYTFQRTARGRTSTFRLWISQDYPHAKEMHAYQLAFAGVNKAAKVTRPDAFGLLAPEDIPVGLIMRIETEIPRGGKSVATTISAKFAPVEDDVFAVPTGYTEQRPPTRRAAP